ncbi:hypothetical protein IRJ41_015025 [Triplophysa rosa]|uniref:Uncharacterized protein n=1 Tax=Triplophysa rosa TaxID=992332 RepID=A0A9W7TML0_TRIRA|nr:hypothetical protein IRJ41_015025 [Triplophysa rosa]
MIEVNMYTSPVLEANVVDSQLFLSDDMSEADGVENSRRPRESKAGFPPEGKAGFPGSKEGFPGSKAVFPESMAVNETCLLQGLLRSSHRSGGNATYNTSPILPSLPKHLGLSADFRAAALAKPNGESTFIITLSFCVLYVC